MATSREPEHATHRGQSSRHAVDQESASDIRFLSCGSRATPGIARWCSGTLASNGRVDRRLPRSISDRRTDRSGRLDNNRSRRPGPLRVGPLRVSLVCDVNEQRRAVVLTEVVGDDLSPGEGAASLGCPERRLWRLLRKLKASAPAVLVRQSRGAGASTSVACAPLCSLRRPPTLCVAGCTDPAAGPKISPSRVHPLVRSQ